MAITAITSTGWSRPVGRSGQVLGAFALVALGCVVSAPAAVAQARTAAISQTIVSLPGTAVALNERGDVLVQGDPTDDIWHPGGELEPVSEPSDNFQATMFNDPEMVAGFENQGGYQNPYDRAAVWQSGVTQWIAPPVASNPRAINDAGQVLEQVASPTAQDPFGQSAVVWAHGVAARLPLPSTEVYPAGINAAGQSTGTYNNADASDSTAYWCATALTCVALSMPAGARYGSGSAINDQGQIAGSVLLGGVQSPVLWTSGQPQVLGTLGGQFNEIAAGSQALNQRGDVIGTSELATGAEHAWLWHAGALTDLGTLGGMSSHAAALNNQGDVVGNSTLADGTSLGFFWHEGVMSALAMVPGTSSCSAQAINDQDEVIGQCSEVGPHGGFAAYPVLWQVSVTG
jgi:probable HAF family extracellular repeat protein